MGSHSRLIQGSWSVLSVGVVALLVSACGGGDGGGPLSASGCAPNCPTANAGPDQTVLVLKQVSLDGSQSSSPATQLLTYQWTLTEKPATSTATLAGSTTVRPTFTADVVGMYTVKLVVSSGAGVSTPDTVRVTAGTGNLPPVANAGSDETVPVGKLVTLDGRKSHDPNETPVTYIWRLQAQPPKSQAVLLNPTSATPSMTPDVAGDYKLSLTVSDGTLTSPAYQLTVTASTGNSPPIANAGPDQTVSTGQRVTLTGAGSRDPDGDPLTYNWCLRSKPEGSTATLADAHTVSPSFTPDVAGLYVMCLSVRDGKVSSDVDAVVLEARTGQPGSFNGPVMAIIAVPDTSGDIYVAGNFTTYNDQPVRPLIRVRPNGALNDTFVLSNAIVPSVSLTDKIMSIAEADDGSGDIYVAEMVPGGNGRRGGRLWRVNSDGTVDSAFPMGELMPASDPMSIQDVLSATVVPVGDGFGRVYVGGVFNRYNGTPVGGTVRVNPNGTLDPTFNAIHWSALIVPVKDGSGEILVVSYSRTGPSSVRPQQVHRLNQDGSGSAFLFSVLSITTNSIHTVALTNDGSGDILVGGDFTYDPIRRLIRINPDGTADTTSPQLQIDQSVYAPAVFVLAKAIDGTGDWYVVQGSRLTRYKLNGSIDPTFTIGQVGGGYINVLLQTSDGSGDLYIGGSFSSYNGGPVGGLVRVNKDGTLD